MNRRTLIAGAAALAASIAVPVSLVAAASPAFDAREFADLVTRLSPAQKRQYANTLRTHPDFNTADAPKHIFNELADVIDGIANRQEA